MRPAGLRSWFPRAARVRLLLAALLAAVSGCLTGASGRSGGDASGERASGAEDFGAESSLLPAPGEARPSNPRVIDFAVFQAQVPVEGNAAMKAAWTHMRETLFDRATAVRLHENGLRVGVGNAGWWPAVKQALEQIEGCRVSRSEPIRVPVDFQLSLELDSEPREQTLFVVGRDGVLSGGTWPESRNILRVVASPPRSDGSLRIDVTPELHQRLEGWETVRSESGLYEVPRQNRVSFDSAAFALDLAADEYVLIAAEDGRQGGVIGGAFLTRAIDGRAYASYVFIKPYAVALGGPHTKSDADGLDAQ